MHLTFAHPVDRCRRPAASGEERQMIAESDQFLAMTTCPVQVRQPPVSQQPGAQHAHAAAALETKGKAAR